MNPNHFPTKGNLVKARATLKMSKLGYNLIDKKRNVLIKEIMDLNDRAAEIQNQIHTTFQEAYLALQQSNISMGINRVQTLSYGTPIEDGIDVRIRSIMGVEIPELRTKEQERQPQYGFMDTTVSLDEAVEKFNKVKQLTIELCQVETAAYRLASNIKKTQRRANALKNVTIPEYEALTKEIAITLEERERDEFTRLKVLKKK